MGVRIYNPPQSVPNYNTSTYSSPAARSPQVPQANAAQAAKYQTLVSGKGTASAQVVEGVCVEHPFEWTPEGIQEMQDFSTISYPQFKDDFLNAVETLGEDITTDDLHDSENVAFTLRTFAAVARNYIDEQNANPTEIIDAFTPLANNTEAILRRFADQESITPDVAAEVGALLDENKLHEAIELVAMKGTEITQAIDATYEDTGANQGDASAANAAFNVAKTHCTLGKILQDFVNETPDNGSGGNGGGGNGNGGGQPIFPLDNIFGAIFGLPEQFLTGLQNGLIDTVYYAGYDIFGQ